MRTIILFMFLTFAISGFSQTIQKYEYLTMTQELFQLTISRSSGNFETFNVKAEGAKAYDDFSPLLKRIEKLEEEGWELFSNNVYTSGEGNSARNYVLMRRKK